jgi:hypothetical protein
MRSRPFDVLRRRPTSRALVLLRLALIPLALAALTLAGCAPRAAPPDGAAARPSSRQFTFAWRYDGDEMAPRGGTTHGPAVELDEAPSGAWRVLQDPGPSKLERDRRAILAMAGTFRTTFDFLEVVGFRPDFKPDRPYQSWGTEYVYVVSDTPRFVSLQHLLVMFVQAKDGKVQGPFVVKHWRQDWRYEDTELLAYRGANTWMKERVPRARVKGAWTQAVFQVDDSPRYEAYGRWEHLGNASTWTSSTTWRPLPRREFSVRKDYDLLIGTNRVTITPTGWVQLEDNLKVALDAPGRPASDMPVLAEELGVERFERLRNFDDSAGRRYAERTEPFWREVRAAWDDVIAARRQLVLRAAPDQAQLFLPLFEHAERLYEGEPFDATTARRVARETVRSYLAEQTAGSDGPRRPHRSAASRRADGEAALALN